MGIGTYILIFYLTGAGLIAIYLGWQMITYLDEYDWRYDKNNIWTLFTFSTLLWFIILPIANRNIKTILRTGGSHFTSRAREENNLWNNPPPCSSVIRYSQHDYNEKILGTFLFDSDDVEDIILDKTESHSNLARGQEGAMLNWLQQRDDSDIEPTDVPKAWDRFEYIADDLLRHEYGDIFCIACDRAVSHQDLVKNDDNGLSGWNSNRLVCNAGHLLFEVKTIHILRSSS